MIILIAFLLVTERYFSLHLPEHCSWKGGTQDSVLLLVAHQIIQQSLYKLQNFSLSINFSAEFTEI